MGHRSLRLWLSSTLTSNVCTNTDVACNLAFLFTYVRILYLDQSTLKLTYGKLYHTTYVHGLLNLIN